MQFAGITPCRDCLLIQLFGKSTLSLSNVVKETSWLRWEQMKDVNGTGRMQWYIVVDTTANKDQRLRRVADILQEEGYVANCKICPHDDYYEDYQKYFT